LSSSCSFELIEFLERFGRLLVPKEEESICLPSFP
jgi:hypothetical protein